MKTITVVSAIGDPTVPTTCDWACGVAPFNTIAETSLVESELGIDYALIQRLGRSSRTWLADLAGGGYLLRGLGQTDLALVTTPQGGSGLCAGGVPVISLGTLDVRWSGPWLPAYKVDSSLAPALVSGSDLTSLCGPDGLLGLELVHHLREDPDHYLAAMLGLPGLAAAEYRGTGKPTALGGEGGHGSLYLLVPPADADAAIRSLARCEPVLAVMNWSWDKVTFPNDDASWQLQTWIAPSTLGPPPAPPVNEFGYDTTAKLFAHGITGLGQVVAHADRGFAAPTARLLSITSSEPEDDPGDGSTMPDIADADFGTADFDFRLRAERSGTGRGRAHSIVYEVRDGTGLRTEASVAVTVGHDRRQPSAGTRAPRPAPPRRP